MKQRAWLALFSCAALLLVLGIMGHNRSFLSTPVPNPSRPSGYYDSPFTLELDAPKSGTIYYTTNGSTPTTESLVYHGGIPITDHSDEPNIYNSIKNIVPDWNIYTPSPQPVPKGTVIRALYVSPLGQESDILTQTYFIGMDPPENGLTLSLVFQYDDLFGEDGIYITGSEFDEWLLAGGEGEAPVANYFKETAVCAIADLFGENGNILNQPVGLMIQGNSSRKKPKKRFVLSASQEYSGKNVFDAPIFEGVTTHSVMLKDVPMDAMAAQLVSDRDVSVQHSIPVRLYLNGEYWQDTYMLERYDQQYFRQYYNVSDRLRVKDAGLDEESLELAGSDIYGEYMFWAQTTDFHVPEEWASFCKETDVQSYVDYIAINYFLCNYDFSQWHNYMLWRSNSAGSSPFADQRWRWCIYDVDAIDNIEIAHPEMPPAEVDIFTCIFRQTDIVLNQNTLFLALKQNSEARQQFVTSFLDIGNNNFAPERVEPILHQFGLDLGWKDGYFRNRFSYAAQYLAREFDLSGTLETIYVTSEHPEFGDVRVGTSVIDLSKGSWSGQYFTDYPITLTALPKDGYTFVGWRGSSIDSSDTITVPITRGLQLEAVFSEK